VEALRLAESNDFSDIYLNTSFSTITRGNVRSLIRPDVTAQARPELQSPFRLRPYEIFSNRQTAEQRQAQMPSGVSWIAPVDGRGYKKFLRLWLNRTLQKLEKLCW
jgi:hypothetical protein